MGPRKATIFYGGFLHKAGGAFMHATSIKKELERLGWQVSLITLDSIPIWCRYLPHLTQILFNFIKMPLGFAYKGKITRLLYKLYFSIEDNLRIFEDIYIAWNSTVPSVTILHAVWSDNLQTFSLKTGVENKLKEVESKLINKIEHPIVTVSYPYLNYLKEEHFKNYALRNLGVIELGVDYLAFNNSRGALTDKKSIVYVGALEARKNVLFLLKVYEALYRTDSEYKLTIIGDGPEKEVLYDFSKDKQLKVSFLGKLSHEVVLKELYQHSIYLHTSVKESFSYSLLEAKLAGLKTCAFSGLQVPSEFIDVPVLSFSIDDWCKSILNIGSAPERFNRSRYSVKEMTLSTLNLVDMPTVSASNIHSH